MGETKYSAYELVEGNRVSPVLFSCEHASQELPPEWTWDVRDRRLVSTHWAFDLGAAELTREFADAYNAPAILARFSRLLVDPNRPIESNTLFRDHAEGEPVFMNTDVEPGERSRRLERCYEPYHEAFHRLVGESSAGVLFSVHSFTPVYEGAMREMEVGVLFDEDEGLAHELAEVIAGSGFRVALNEPYSGKGGLMYSVQRHATAHRRRAVELELRQDLAVQPAIRAKLIQCLLEAKRVFTQTP